MTQEQDNLLRECHAMLTEIVGYVLRIQSKEYIDEDTVKRSQSISQRTCLWTGWRKIRNEPFNKSK